MDRLNRRKVATAGVSARGQLEGMWDPAKWTIMRKKGHQFGAWFRVRNLDTLLEAWIGTTYIAPHHGVLDLQTNILEAMTHLPPTTLPCILAGDTNAAITWSAVEGSASALG